MKKLTILVILLIISGCVSKKTAVKKAEIVSSNSELHMSVTEIKPTLAGKIVINQVCDTITGKATSFEQHINVGRDSLLIKLEDNKLTGSIITAEKIYSQKDSVIQKINYSNISSESTTIVKTKWTKVTWILLALNLLMIFLPVIPNTLHKLIFKI